MRNILIDIRLLSINSTSIILPEERFKKAITIHITAHSLTLTELDAYIIIFSHYAIKFLKIIKYLVVKLYYFDYICYFSYNLNFL